MTGIVIALLLGLVAVLLLVVPWASDAFEGPKRLIWCGILTLLTGYGLFQGKDEGRRGLDALGILLFLLLFWMVFRCWVAGFHWRSLGPLCIWALPIVSFLAISRFPLDEKASERFFCIVAVLGAFEALTMLSQRYGFDPFFGSTTREIAYAPGRMIGTVGYQNQAAEFLGLALLALPFSRIGGKTSVVLGGLAFAALVLTANRGAMLGIAVVGAALLVSRRGKFPAKCGRCLLVAVVVAVGLAVSVLVAEPEIKGRLAELIRPSRSLAVQSRLWMDKAALRLWDGNPLAGAGAGEYAYNYMDLLGKVLPEKRTHNELHALVYAREAHCDFLQFGAEFGLIGIALVGGAVFLLVRRHRECIPLLAFMTVCSCVNFSWQTSVAGPLAGLMLGMLSRKGTLADSEENVGGKGVWIWRQGALCAFAVAAFAVCLSDALHVPLRGVALADMAGEAAINGEYRKAEGMFEKALEDFKSPEMLNNYAFTEYELGRYDRAYELYAECAKSGLGYFDALKNMSIVAERQEKWELSARMEFERFQLVKDSFSDTEVFRMVVLLTRVHEYGQASEVLRWFEKICRRRRISAWTSEWDNLKGAVALKLGDVKTAKKCFADALEKNPELESARRNLGMLLDEEE